jgi:hypothetical protein
MQAYLIRLGQFEQRNGAQDGRLANLLKILVALICLAAILQRLLPMIGVGGI